MVQCVSGAAISFWLESGYNDKSEIGRCTESVCSTVLEQMWSSSQKRTSGRLNLKKNKMKGNDRYIGFSSDPMNSVLGIMIEEPFYFFKESYVYHKVT